MCEINIESISKLLEFKKSDIKKPNNIKPANDINNVRNLIKDTKNFIGAMDICQLSQNPKIEKYKKSQKIEKNYIIIIKALRNIESSTIIEKLSHLTPIGVGIIYVEDENDEDILIVS